MKERLDVFLAVVEAHLLSVEGAPLRGRTGTTADSRSQRACVHLASARVDATGPVVGAPPPRGPRALSDAREARTRAWGERCPPLGIPLA
jgi:hypothetical protein